MDPAQLPKVSQQERQPIVAGVWSAEPEEVGFLKNSGPLDSDASFEKSEPSNAVLCVDGLKKTWHVGLGMRKGSELRHSVRC